MTTRAIMLAEMADDMERSDTTLFTNKINAAIRHYQPKRFFFNESRSVTFNTVASTDVYRFGAALEITTEFYRLDGVFITIAADDVRELTRANYVDLEAKAGNNTDPGEPSEYAFINKAIRLWANPDAIYSTRLMGHVKLAAPAADDEVGNDWMVEAYDLIMSRAKAELYAHTYGDMNSAMVMQQAEASALQSLRDATDDKVATGYLEATEF